jgi:chromosome segregation ATPase
MNDKERLRRLKRLNNLSNVWEYLEQTTLYGGNALKESWEWLISQAEKVEQLQKEIERLQDIEYELNQKLQAEQWNFLECNRERNEYKQQLQQAQAKIERYENALIHIGNSLELHEDFFVREMSFVAQQALEGDTQ